MSEILINMNMNGWCNTDGVEGNLIYFRWFGLKVSKYTYGDNYISFFLNDIKVLK